MKKLLIVVCVAVAVMSAGCTAIELTEKVDVKDIYLLLGDSVEQDFLREGKWQSSDASVCAIDDTNIVGIGVGKCLIKGEIGKNVTVYNVVVCDKIVSKKFDNNTVGFGIKKFDKIQDALADGGTIVIGNGDYQERLYIDKNSRLVGVGIVKILGVKGVEYALEGIIIQSNEFPPVGESLVFAEEQLAMKDCEILVSTDLVAKDIPSGVGIWIANDGKMLKIEDCVISNFAVGVQIAKYNGAILVESNDVVNCNIGISVDVKGKENMLSSYGASGTIKGNIYLDNHKDTEFIYTGISYVGELDYYDYSKIAIKHK